MDASRPSPQVSPMKRITDSLYVIGSTHRECQDYAAHALGQAYLSDGCSGAPKTDVGARLLCLRALAHDPVDPPDIREIATVVRPLAHEVIPTAGVMSLYATLFGVGSDTEGSMWFAGIGDGALLRIDSRTGGALLEVWEPSNEQRFNAPPYPLHHTDLDSLRAYETAVGTSTPLLLRTYEFDGEAWRESRQDHVGSLLGASWGSQEWDLAVVFSDGLSSFQAHLERVPPTDVSLRLLTRLLRTPRTSGFLTRCMSMVLRDLRRDGVVHTDDFSASAVWVVQ